MVNVGKYTFRPMDPSWIKSNWESEIIPKFRVDLIQENIGMSFHHLVKGQLCIENPGYKNSPIISNVIRS